MFSMPPLSDQKEKDMAASDHAGNCSVPVQLLSNPELRRWAFAAAAQLGLTYSSAHRLAAVLEEVAKADRTDHASFFRSR